MNSARTPVNLAHPATPDVCCVRALARSIAGTLVGPMAQRVPPAV